MAIQLVGFLFLAIGGAILAWYKTLSQEDQMKADDFAWAYARKKFGVTAKEQLTEAQLREATEYAQKNYKPGPIVKT